MVGVFGHEDKRLLSGTRAMDPLRFGADRLRGVWSKCSIGKVGLS